MCVIEGNIYSSAWHLGMGLPYGIEHQYGISIYAVWMFIRSDMDMEQ